MTKSQNTDARGPEATPLSGRRGWGGTIAALPVLLLFVFLAPSLPAQSLTNPREARFGEIRQLTFQGENAEAYWAFDGSRLIFQSTPTPGEGCDQIYILDPDTGETELVSTGDGRTTCSYFYPGGDRILYSSTHHFNRARPAPPDFSRGYVRAVYPSFDIFAADADGTKATPTCFWWIGATRRNRNITFCKVRFTSLPESG